PPLHLLPAASTRRRTRSGSGTRRGRTSPVQATVGLGSTCLRFHPGCHPATLLWSDDVPALYGSPMTRDGTAAHQAMFNENGRGGLRECPQSTLPRASSARPVSCAYLTERRIAGTTRALMLESRPRARAARSASPNSPEMCEIARTMRLAV